MSKSGALGAILTGTAVFGFGGWTPGLLLIAFFVSSSALSHFKQNNATKQHAAEIFEKGGQRDLGQTLANGGAASAFAVVMGLAAKRSYLEGRPVKIEEIGALTQAAH